MKKKNLWMRVGTRVLACGCPGEIVSIWTETREGTEYVNYIDVCLDGKSYVESFHPDNVQLDRIQREVSHA
jgi:hypothetical protein